MLIPTKMGISIMSPANSESEKQFVCGRMRIIIIT